MSPQSKVSKFPRNSWKEQLIRTAGPALFAQWKPDTFPCYNLQAMNVIVDFWIPKMYFLLCGVRQSTVFRSFWDLSPSSWPWWLEKNKAANLDHIRLLNPCPAKRHSHTTKLHSQLRNPQKSKWSLLKVLLSINVTRNQFNFNSVV